LIEFAFVKSDIMSHFLNLAVHTHHQLPFAQVLHRHCALRNDPARSISGQVRRNSIKQRRRNVKKSLHKATQVSAQHTNGTLKAGITGT